MKTRQKIKTLKNFMRVPDFYWLQKIAEWGLDVNDVDFDKESGKILVKSLNILISKDKDDFLLNPETLRMAKSLQKNHSAKFSVDENDELIGEIEGIKGFIQTEEELLILREVFVDGTYNFIHDKPVVVWDIGMNTGFASLYFASNEKVEAVWGYEPFGQTYQQALRNFDLNPLAKKIKAFEYGVSDREQTLVVEYSYEHKASVGIDRIPEEALKQAESLSKAEIRIKPATEVLESMRAEHPGLDIVAKIDCEGSEYEILSSLHAHGQLGHLKMVMIEWHEKGPDQLVENLRDSGFAIFSRRPKSKTIGMLYAVRA